MSVILLARNHFIVDDSSDDLHEVRRFLEVAAKLDRRGEAVVVSFSITFDGGRVYGRKQQGPVTISLYRDHGQRSGLVMDQVDESGSLHQALRYLVGRRQDVEDLGSIERVEMTVTPPR